jgi:hypothetical protein
VVVNGKENKMTKISKLILGAGALGVLGITALPLTGYAADVITTVTVAAQDDTGGGTGGNNAKGYAWTVKDKETNGSINLITGSALGAATGGIAPAATASAYTASNATAQYGVKFTPVVVNASTTLTGVVGTFLAISNSAQAIGTTSNAGYIQAWPTGVNVSPAAGVFFGTDTDTSGSAVSLTARWDSTLPVGTYQNTVTITQVANV